MRGLGGFVLLAGIGVGLFVYFPAPVDRDTSLEQAQRVMATRVASSATSLPARPKSHATPRALHHAWPASLRRAHSPPRNAKSRAAATPAAPAAPVIAAAVTVETMPAWHDERVAGRCSRWAAGLARSDRSGEPLQARRRHSAAVEARRLLLGPRQRLLEQQHARGDALVHDARPTPRCRSRSPITCCCRCCKSHSGRSMRRAGNDRCCTAAWQASEQVAATAPAPEVLPWKAGSAAQPATRSIRHCRTASSRLSRCRAAWPSAARGSCRRPCRRHSFPAPRRPPDSRCRHRCARAWRRSTGFRSAPAAGAEAASEPKKSVTATPGPGTPRYNLMLSLGGVY